MSGSAELFRGLRGLQPALDRHHYIDAASFAREAEMLRREWTCIGRLDDLGLAASGRRFANRRVVTAFLGESIIVTADAAGSLARVRERVPTPRFAGRAGRAGRPAYAL